LFNITILTYFVPLAWCGQQQVSNTWFDPNIVTVIVCTLSDYLRNDKVTGSPIKLKNKHSNDFEKIRPKTVPLLDLFGTLAVF